MEWHDPHPIKKEELNPLKAKVEISYESKRKDVVTSLAASCTAAYAAFRILPKPIRVPISTVSIGGLIYFGQCMFYKSFDSGVDQMLALNGTMLQKKVATILLTYCPEHPGSVRLLSKHFYPERILDDSTSDTAKLRWRYRNVFSDNVVHGHGTLALDDCYDSGYHYDPYYKFRGSSYNDSYDSKRTTLRTKQNYIKPETDIVLKVLPFGHFGIRCDSGRINQPNTSKKSQGTNNQSHRRLIHRSRRMHNHNDLSNSDHATAL